MPSPDYARKRTNWHRKCTAYRSRISQIDFSDHLRQDQSDWLCRRDCECEDHFCPSWSNTAGCSRSIHCGAELHSRYVELSWDGPDRQSGPLQHLPSKSEVGRSPPSRLRRNRCPARSLETVPVPGDVHNRRRAADSAPRVAMVSTVEKRGHKHAPQWFACRAPGKEAASAPLLFYGSGHLRSGPRAAVSLTKPTALPPAAAGC